MKVAIASDAESATETASEEVIVVVGEIMACFIPDVEVASWHDWADRPSYLVDPSHALTLIRDLMVIATISLPNLYQIQ